MATHTIETIRPSEKRISVTLDPKTVQKAIQAEVRQLSSRLKYGGFRPNTSAAQQFISNKLSSQEKTKIYQTLYKESFCTICTKENILYEGTPILESIQTNADGSLSYTSLIEVYPDILHISWQNISIQKLVTHIDEDALSEAQPFFEAMKLDKVMQSNQSRLSWCEWMVEIFQHQQLRKEVMQALSKHNTVNDLPTRVVEARYQELKYEQKENVTNSELRQEAKAYITADILFRAYAKEHRIQLDPETLARRIEQAKHNPFIMHHIKDESLIPYYIAPRVFEERVVKHLVENADCQIKTVSLKDFLQAMFKEPKDSSTKQYLSPLT